MSLLGMVVNVMNFFIAMAVIRGILTIGLQLGIREITACIPEMILKRTRFMNARADYQIDNNDNIEFIFGIAAGARGEGDFDQILYTPTTRKIRNHNLLARWKHQFSDSNELTLQAYHAFDRSDTTFTSVNLRSLIPFVLNDNAVVRNPVEQERF